MRKFLPLFFCVMMALLMASCAKRGSITGGLKDTIAPVLRNSFPENYSTNFNVKEIRINFDEYIKLKDVNKQLIISPPMKYAPVVTPSNASKYISIRIKDTLQPNTTYSFNFGNSIQDNNEGNPFQQFKYVFSTGSYIDSLKIGGMIKDAYSKEVDNYVSVMLYEVNETYNDSVVYKQNPRYVTNTLDSNRTFILENLKEGKYLLVAMKDQNNNFRLDPKKDKIGFHPKIISIPTDTLYEVSLFNEIPGFRATRPYQASGNRIVVPVDGDGKDAQISVRNGQENIPVKVTKMPKQDSLQVWFKPIKTDSVHLLAKKNKFEKEFMVKMKNMKTDTLSFTAEVSGTLLPRDKFSLTSSIPIDKIDNSKISIQKKDSSAVAFTTSYDEFDQKITIDFKNEPLERYKITAFPGAFTDLLERVNDTLTYPLNTQDLAQYGNLRIQLENVKRFPVIVEITNEKGDLITSGYSEGEKILDFDGLQPNTFTVRIIYDDNKNRKWDTGNFVEKRQPEEVIYYPGAIVVRANWDVDERVTLPPH